MPTIEVSLSDLPPHNEEQEHKITFAQFEPSEFRRMRKIAKDRGQTVPELIRDCIIFALPNDKTVGQK